MELQIKKDRLYLMLKNLPSVSPEEMKDIEKAYGFPSKRREVFQSKEIEL